MKKARFFLTALTVLAVVGGALAFKAKQPLQYSLCDVQKSICTVDPQFQQFKTTSTILPGVTIGRNIHGSPCVTDPVSGLLTCTTYVTFAEN